MGGEEEEDAEGDGNQDEKRKGSSPPPQQNKLSGGADRKEGTRCRERQGTHSDVAKTGVAVSWTDPGMQKAVVTTPAAATAVAVRRREPWHRSHEPACTALEDVCLWNTMETNGGRCKPKKKVDTPDKGEQAPARSPPS